jgi:hypothetical protein
MPVSTPLQRTTSRITIFSAASAIGIAIRNSPTDRCRRFRCGSSSTRRPPTTEITS